MPTRTKEIRASAVAGSARTLGKAESTWLSDRDLLVLWGSGSGSPRQTEVVLQAPGGFSAQMPCCTIDGGILIHVALPSSCQAPDAAFAPDLHAPEAKFELILRQDHQEQRLCLAGLVKSCDELASFLRRHCTALDCATRHRVMHFIATAHAQDDSSRNYQLSASRIKVREALRERLPRVRNEPQSPLGFHVDALYAIDDRSFYLRGWMRDNASKPTRMTLISPEGACHELLGREFHHVRPDVDQLYGPAPGDALRSRSGILCFLTSPSPCMCRSGWIAQVHSASGAALEGEVPQVIDDPKLARDAMLSDILCERLDGEDLLPNHLRPAFARLQNRHSATLGIDFVRQFGIPAASPHVTILTPLYGRVDFVEQQLAQYANDPQMRETDLLFVLDSPELAAALLHSAESLFQLYRVPFRIAVMKVNGGFSAVNNFGAALARAPLLLLLNADILPARPGWLGRMIEIYRSVPNIGSLGAKLLYEDDTIQHAGMYFYRHPSSGYWTNEHYFKGLHRALPGANVARPVPALTAACLMIDRELYQQLGGLSGEYVQGDYEDSDFSLRLSAAGRENWYTPDIEMYHLEGQSYPAPLRAVTTRFNRWLHTRKWDAEIQNVMSRLGDAAASSL